MSTPLVSVIVPLYNKRAWIERALHSIAAQTFTSIEVLVVDDGSTDGSGEVAASYPDSRFRVIRQENAGPGAARNRGLEEARAELVAFLDGDDEWLPDYLETSVAALEKMGPDVAAVSSSFLNGESEVSSEPVWRARGITEGVHRAHPGMDPELLVQQLAFMHCCTTVARRRSVLRWGSFYAQDKCRYAEDAFLFLQILLNENVGFHLPAHMRIHHDAGSLSQNLTTVRALEPFLEHPQRIEANCPPELRPLLSQLMALRAFKTACVFGYWGQWRRAAALRRQFRTRGDGQLPYFWYSWLFSTPFGAAAGNVWRGFTRRSDPPLR
ncbi:MAG: glycosyltransferase family 2 protein [Bryobacteraceae bacterium]|nr:glycosyltransferase family 2 protein [Bryobacteraceae bacterium]